MGVQYIAANNGDGMIYSTFQVVFEIEEVSEGTGVGGRTTSYRVSSATAGGTTITNPVLGIINGSGKFVPISAYH